MEIKLFDILFCFYWITVRTLNLRFVNSNQSEIKPKPLQCKVYTESFRHRLKIYLCYQGNVKPYHLFPVYRSSIVNVVELQNPVNVATRTYSNKATTTKKWHHSLSRYFSIIFINKTTKNNPVKHNRPHQTFQKFCLSQMHDARVCYDKRTVCVIRFHCLTRTDEIGC